MGDSQVADRFKYESRKDGWPLCPRCTEDELYSYIALRMTTAITLEQALTGEFGCYRCSWHGFVPSQEIEINDEKR